MIGDRSLNFVPSLKDFWDFFFQCLLLPIELEVRKGTRPLQKSPHKSLAITDGLRVP